MATIELHNKGMADVPSRTETKRDIGCLVEQDEGPQIHSIKLTPVAQSMSTSVDKVIQ